MWLSEETVQCGRAPIMPVDDVLDDVDDVDDEVMTLAALHGASSNGIGNTGSVRRLRGCLWRAESHSIRPGLARPVV